MVTGTEKLSLLQYVSVTISLIKRHNNECLLLQKNEVMSGNFNWKLIQCFLKTQVLKSLCNICINKIMFWALI